MSLKDEIAQINLERLALAWRPAQVYVVAAPGPNYNLFTITGAVEIVTLGGFVTAAAVGATTLRIQINGVVSDAGAVAINGAVGTVVYHPINAGGAIVNAAAIPKTVATLTSNIAGIQPAAVGFIRATFGVGTSWTGQFFCVYRRLGPASNIV